MAADRAVAWWLLPSARCDSGRQPRSAAAGAAPHPRSSRTAAIYVAAADCVACHTAPGGAPFAGGVPLPSPFGTIHGTNITPDARTGIGRYTSDDFFHALTKGEARDGHQLYPAMPYVSYKAITRADSDAIYAYLMNQPAVTQNESQERRPLPGQHPQPACTCGTCCSPAPRRGPASQGEFAGMAARPLSGRNLGHCGECHSPRGALGQVDRERPLAGNSKLGRFAAPDITPQGLAARGWDAAIAAANTSPPASSCACGRLGRDAAPWCSCRRAGSTPRRSRCDDYLPARRRAAGAGTPAQWRCRSDRAGPGPAPLSSISAPDAMAAMASGVPNVAVSLRAQQQRARFQSAQSHRRHPRRPARARLSGAGAHAGHARLRRATSTMPKSPRSATGCACVTARKRDRCRRKPCCAAQQRD